MIKQLVEDMSDAMSSKVIEDFMASESIADIKRIRDKYDIKITDEMLGYMQELDVQPTLSDEEQEYIAGGKTNFLLNKHDAYKGSL